MIDVRVPTSKAHTQRALIAACLADGESELVDPSTSDDAACLRDALRKMGVEIRVRDRAWMVRGTGRLGPPESSLAMGNSGAATRFLMGTSLIVDGSLSLTGSPAMQRRPHAALLDALESLGIRVHAQNPGHLPLQLTGPCQVGRAEVAVDASLSSQYVSALLLPAPRLASGLSVRMTGSPVSRPYVAVTLEVMRAFGAEVLQLDDRTIRVSAIPYGRTRYEVEADETCAAYVLVASELAGTPVRITNARESTRQGDRAMRGILRALRCPHAVELDLADTPDLVPAVTALALFRPTTTDIVGIAHLRIKESDRLQVLARELRKVGANIVTLPAALRIEPTTLHGCVALDPHADHRMAMAFGLVGLRLSGIEVLDRACVTKSFPGFFELLERFR